MSRVIKKLNKCLNNILEKLCFYNNSLFASFQFRLKNDTQFIRKRIIFSGICFLLKEFRNPKEM